MARTEKDYAAMVMIKKIFFVYALAFYYGGILISNEEYSYSEFVHVFMAITFMGFGIGQTASLAPDVAKSKNAISIIFKMIDRESKIDPFASGKTIEESNIGEEDFQFKNVQFKYPSRPNVKVFTKLNLDIKKNTTVALVGMSGSGKSSVIKMIERFYDVNRGELLHHGENIKDLDQVWYRNEMALVSQEPDLFNASILENISFGLPEKDFIEDKGRVIEAAKSAGAHDFIEALPDGYDTSIKASSLSGGQKQRIAIARALIRQPKVLLLDEATSALDNETEKLVQVSLDKYSKEHGLTCVVVAHRLSSIQHADVIHVVHQGVIVESGTHSKLISDVNGAYYKLYKSQN